MTCEAERERRRQSASRTEWGCHCHVTWLVSWKSCHVHIHSVTKVRKCTTFTPALHNANNDLSAGMMNESDCSHCTLTFTLSSFLYLSFIFPALCGKTHVCDSQKKRVFHIEMGHTLPVESKDSLLSIHLLSYKISSVIGAVSVHCSSVHMQELSAWLMVYVKHSHASRTWQRQREEGRRSWMFVHLRISACNGSIKM